MDNSNSFYATFAQDYDHFSGDRSSTFKMIDHCLHQQAAKEGSSVLELACGTGQVLKHLGSRFKITGLDSSPEMLKFAEKTVGKNISLIQDNMQTFSLNEKFDVILAVFDSINHLVSIEDWRITFENVHRHLASNGIFIFDINTPQKIARLNQISPVVTYKDFDLTVILEVKPLETKKSSWHFTVFKNTHHDNQFIKLENTFTETILSQDTITNTLKNVFSKIDIITPEAVLKDKISFDQIGKQYFICRK